MTPSRLGAPIFLVCLMLVLTSLGSFARPTGERLPVHLFLAEGCPHCAEAEPFLRRLQGEQPQLEIRTYDVWNDRQAFELMIAAGKSVGISAVSTPGIVIGDRIWFGFDEQIAEQIVETIEHCQETPCTDLLERIATRAPTAPPLPGNLSASVTDPAPSAQSLVIPGLGRMQTERYSLPTLTVVIGLLDSFNPCAFFVLFFLLSLLVHARSRRIMLLVGTVFVGFSGLIYFLFMAAWLNLFLLAGELRLITGAAGAVALVIAGINIKDFFWFREGITLSIPDAAKPKLFGRMRQLLKTTRTTSILFGTAILAIGANSYELLCTAGFPMVYTRLLTLHALPSWQHYLYLGLYNLVYVLPLLIIVMIFTFSLGTRKLSEWQGRVLKLVSGMMMLVLGGVLLIDPALLNNLAVSLGLLGAALAVSALTVLIWKTLGRSGADTPRLSGKKPDRMP